MVNTLFDKIWDAHVVQVDANFAPQLYIDRLYCHEVTSPQAFAGLCVVELNVFVPSGFPVCPIIIHLPMIRTNRYRIL